MLAATASAAAAMPRTTNGTRIPYAPPSGPPASGPSNDPRLAAAMAPASRRPRSAGAESADSQARPADHEMAELIPWPARAATSTQKLSATPKARVATASSPTPATVVRLAPSRSAQWPTGTEATSTAAE